MGGAGEEPVSCPALSQEPSTPGRLCPFNSCSCWPHLGSGWFRALHLALLGRLQEEAEAVAFSTLGFPDITDRKSQTQDVPWGEGGILPHFPHGTTRGELVQPSTPSGWLYLLFKCWGPPSPSFQEAESSLPFHCIHRVKPTCDGDLLSLP